MPEAQLLRKPRLWLLLLKLCAAVVVGLVLFTFVPGRFVPAFAAPAYETLVTARRTAMARVRAVLARQKPGQAPGVVETEPTPTGEPSAASVSGHLTVCSVSVPELGGATATGPSHAGRIAAGLRHCDGSGPDRTPVPHAVSGRRFSASCGTGDRVLRRHAGLRFSPLAL